MTNAGPVTCSMCGRQESQPPITWMRENDASRGPVWICQDCARRNLRGIESRLNQEWW